MFMFVTLCISYFFFFSSRRRHTRLTCDWSSDVCSSDLASTSKRRRNITNKNEMADKVRGVLGSLKMLQDEQVEKAQKKLMQAGIRSKDLRSEEGRVGEEGRARGWPYHLKKKKKKRESRR